MNHILLLLASNLVSVACVIAASYLAIRGTEGWGWFLLIAVLCSTSLKTTDTL